MHRALVRKLGKLWRFVRPDARTRRAVALIRGSGAFDKRHYLRSNPTLNALFRRFPERHYVLFGERDGLQPNPHFVARLHRRLADNLAAGDNAFAHAIGNDMLRLAAPARPLGVDITLPAPPARPDRPAPYAIALHLYYGELWDEFAAHLAGLDIAFDLYVTLSEDIDGLDRLRGQIARDMPRARVITLPNCGRDILPFAHLANCGVFAGYRAVCKLHGKKSPHLEHGESWRQTLVAGILPRAGLGRALARFGDDPRAALWVADGGRLRGARWWMANRDLTLDLLRRVEILADPDALCFPAGSIWWAKPLMIDMLAGLRLTPADFGAEIGTLDGTAAHAVERAMGYFAQEAGQRIVETAELSAPARARARPPAYVSAFHLPQFHRVPENDAWWGPGYTEWRAASDARPVFDGHDQPAAPAPGARYDLSDPAALGAQAALARGAGIDGFCCYHYWFGGKRLLQAPLDNLLRRPEVDFPFYLCWANESWRRNWDGQSGTVLMEQRYDAGFEDGLAQSLAPYLRDRRYQRPDGSRPRLVIYRPAALPAPARNIARLRQALARLGVPQLELGAVWHGGDQDRALPSGLTDFWVEMPPHALVRPTDHLAVGPLSHHPAIRPAPGFSGLIYAYRALARNACDPAHMAALPANTIAGIMPGWDNTARRGLDAHIAYGANPAAFAHWLAQLGDARLQGSYRHEIFINAWNEWGEKAVLEPGPRYGRAYLDVLQAWRRPCDRAETAPTGITQTAG